MTTADGQSEFRISMAKRTFWQRVRSMALWWGIPAVGAELYGVPRNLWLYALILAIPATAVGVVTGAAILHAVAERRSKASDGGNSST
jgi:hypothetical protein